MKKIGGKSFFIILGICFVTLAVLTMSVILLTKKSSKEFYSAGYIINSTSTKSDKYYFDDNTNYKENVFEEYVFTDTNNKEVTTSKENFIHYLDNSLSFMKNGVILDLDNFNKNVAPYYNITDKSIIKYNNGGYYVENDDKTIIFNNFMGRISENKYIVVGKDLKIKLSGNDNFVTGDYFEILFIEDGIVKVENQEGSYQTISNGSVIYVGDNIKINLGDKNITYSDEIKLSLSEITINGNENIDIIPNGKVKAEEENEGNNGNNGLKQEDNVTDDKNNDNNEGDNVIVKKELSVDLIAARVDINSIDADFQVVDTDQNISGNLILNIKNMVTGDTVYTKILSNAIDIQKVNVNSLTPGCNYLMTVYDEDNIQYFQKLFRTESLDLSVSLEEVTEDSLSYTLNFSDDSDIKSANVSLYKEGELLQQYTINNKENNKAIFTGLNNNTEYDLVVDSVVFKNTNYTNLYSSSLSNKTLKKKPLIGDISVSSSNEGQTISMKIDSISDEDKSITKYTYQIYQADDITMENINTLSPVYSFTRNEFNTETIKIGDNNNLKGKIDYRGKVVVEYFDNYRYNEVETSLSDFFKVVGKPSIEFIKDDIDFNHISGKVKITDTACLIPMNGRECNDDDNEFIIRYYGASTDISSGNEVQDIVVDSEDLTLSFDLLGLTENTLYTFEVYGKADLNGNGEGATLQYLGGFNARTTGIDALKINWTENNSYSYNTPLIVNAEMTSTVPESDYADKVSSITFNLYGGKVKNSIDNSIPLKSFTLTDDIKNIIYNTKYAVTSNLFGIEDLSSLKEISGGRLYSNYTIEITDAYDESGSNKFIVMDNIYELATPALLLLEDKMDYPQIAVYEITNLETKAASNGEKGKFEDDYNITYNSNLNDSTIVGYKVIARFQRDDIESQFSFVTNAVNKIKFNAYNKQGTLIETKEINSFVEDEDEYIVYFFLNEGTDYSVIDTDMRRGNSYYFDYQIMLDTDDDGVGDVSFPSKLPTSQIYDANKVDPSIKFYIDKSDKTSITYKYKIKDYDKAFYKEDGEYKIHYTVSDDINNYTSLVVIDNNVNTFTINNLINGSSYNVSYRRVLNKNKEPINFDLGTYYFDGYYDANDYDLKYSLDYSNYSNILNIKIDDNELLDRISTYLLTLKANDDKYQKVITSSELEDCDGNKCIKIDYKDIVSLKGKDITASLEAFYDTGYSGFGLDAKLNDYFSDYINNKNSSAGFVYQTVGSEKGKYFDITKNGNNKIFSELMDIPRGILVFQFSEENFSSFELNSSNLVDTTNNEFMQDNQINLINKDIDIRNGSIYLKNKKYSITPKLLDRVEVSTLDNKFKFTSIIPKVTAGVIPYINGGSMKINLSIDTSTLENDFVKTDNKYKFYIDIYEDGELVKEVETDYDTLLNERVIFEGLTPNTNYTYKILADMNKNGETVKAPLFDGNKKDGYVEFKSEFNTLSKEKILSSTNDVGYYYDNIVTDDTYGIRTLNIETKLKDNVNFDLKYQVYDNNGELLFEDTVLNENITGSNKNYTARYSHDISGNDFVFAQNYYALVITAVTTDLGKELELFREKLVYKEMTEKKFYYLESPEFSITSQNAGITDNDGSYNYYVEYSVSVKDTFRVITDGIYYMELQNTSGDNACAIGHEDDCKATVNMVNNTCSGKNCNIVAGVTKNITTSNAQLTYIKFDNLEPDTNYILYVYGNTYMNNLPLTEKNGTSFVRKNQFTQSELGFSLGAVTPAIKDDKLVITFVDGSNVKNMLKGIDYNVNADGGDKITKGSIGITDTTDGEIIFIDSSSGKEGENSDVQLLIDIPDKTKLKETNYIIITYYYYDKDSNLTKLKFNDDTSKQYFFKYKK